MDIWSTKEANTIKGTDGSRLPRGLRLGDLKEVFVPMLCRPLKMTAKGFTHPSLYDRLKVLEFQPDASTFNGSHETYCPITVSGPPCPPAGLFDISQCSLPGQISPPIYASMPHFLHGHADLRAPFKGLRKANPRIDTKTGISVEAQLRLQINAYIERTPDLADVFLNVTDRVYLPIAWFEKNEGGSVDTLEVLHHSLEIQPEQIRQILYIVFFCSAAFFVLFTIGSVVVPYSNRTSDFNKNPICQWARVASSPTPAKWNTWYLTSTWMFNTSGAQTINMATQRLCVVCGDEDAFSERPPQVVHQALQMSLLQPLRRKLSSRRTSAT
ncbi:unnamed protein product [Mesocestoides corti]|uniref:Uncharacterized protein n=1 Tax=Mesocestoides corti TaxID=53468 RepID=A0A3P6I9T3_MESCO|nr:unnamed protein product [Mesocestoides corti]